MNNGITESKHWLIPKFYTPQEAAVVLSLGEKIIRRLLLRAVLHLSKATRNKVERTRKGRFWPITRMTYMAFLQQTALTPMFFTVAQAAAMLNLSEKTVRRLLERGILHSSKATRKKLIRRKDIEIFLKGRASMKRTPQERQRLLAAAIWDLVQECVANIESGRGSIWDIAYPHALCVLKHPDGRYSINRFLRQESLQIDESLLGYTRRLADAEGLPIYVFECDF